ncbi:MAG: exonuclease domain-containing protein [Rikenellaceae bacterium]
MELKLERPLVFFDLETTGTDTATDRIVEMSFIKLLPSGERESRTKRVNPTIPIPVEASNVHGIYDKDVEGEPEFSRFARSLKEWLEGCDLAGYNSNKFDVPLLVEEFLRAGVEFDINEVRLVDVQNIFFKKEPRTLSAAYKFYCGREIENAHSAKADIEATCDVLLAQIEKYGDIGTTVEELSSFSTIGNNVDLAGRIVRNERGEMVFNFGKHKGKRVEDVFRSEPSFYSWMMGRDFSLDTKRVIEKIKNNMK